MSDLTITIRLFGAFRKYGEEMELSVPAGSSVKDVKIKLAEKIDEADRPLIDESAIANDDEIMVAETVFTRDSQLAILPPVCGG